MIELVEHTGELEMRLSAPTRADLYSEALRGLAAEVSEAARRLLTSLYAHAPARDLEIEAEKARERSRLRFG